MSDPPTNGTLGVLFQDDGSATVYPFDGVFLVTGVLAYPVVGPVDAKVIARPHDTPPLTYSVREWIADNPLRLEYEVPWGLVSQDRPLQLTYEGAGHPPALAIHGYHAESAEAFREHTLTALDQARVTRAFVLHESLRWPARTQDLNVPGAWAVVRTAIEPQQIKTFRVQPPEGRAGICGVMWLPPYASDVPSEPSPFVHMAARVAGGPRLTAGPFSLGLLRQPHDYLALDWGVVDEHRAIELELQNLGTELAYVGLQFISETQP